MKRIFLLLLLLAPGTYAQDAPVEIKPEQVMPYLEQVIAYSHAITDAEQLPDNGRETILKDALKVNAKKILQKSFEFASAQSMVFDSDKSDAPEPVSDADTSRKGKLLKAIADNNKNIDDLREKLSGPGIPTAVRERKSGELKMALAQQELLKTLRGIFNSDDTGPGSLSDQVKALSRSELLSPEASSENAVKATPEKEIEQAQDSDGMLKLSTTMFSYSRKQAKIGNLIDLNKDLAQKNRAIATAIRASLRAAIEAGKALSADGGTDPKSMADYRQSLAELMARYKMLSATIIPIGEINVLLEGSLDHLGQWEKLIGQDWSKTVQQLVMRLVILGIAVAIPLVCSGAAHRAIMHYVKDSRRQRQLNIVRRIILIIFLTFIILANFMTEFGSLATFAGFITAGLAVALQTVLVSLVAHFFFFGRYGIKAGDRVTISDVTGDVMQVGVLRLYIRELREQDGKWIPSGKMVAFPNSILFQPAAFYKHIDEI